MIVRSANGALHLITQPDHAALARRLMERWAALGAENRRASILVAVEQHDGGWIEPDAAPSVDPATGRVRDFMTAPAAVKQGVWARALARLTHDPWAAALVAHHAITVYDRYRADPEWTRFFAETTAARAALLDAAAARAAAEPDGSGTPARMRDLLHDYTYVRIGDLISLMFCDAWTDVVTYRNWTFRREGPRVSVSPDGFGGRDVPFTVPAAEIPDRPYASDGDLRAAIAAARRMTLAGSCGSA